MYFIDQIWMILICFAYEQYRKYYSNQHIQNYNVNVISFIKQSNKRNNFLMSVVPPQETLKYMNQARTNPSKFAKYIKQQLDTFINPTTLPLKPGCNYSTNEGKGAWTQAYNFLLKQKPLPAMELHKGLTLAAEDHAIDMANTGIFGHNSSNGASFSARIEKRCGKSYGSSGQNIGSDFKVAGRNHALKTIMGLIIDDGVPNRGHRKNIFSTDFKYVGISSRIQDDKVITVLDYHSNNLSINDGSQNTNNVGMNINYQKPKQESPFSGGFGNNGWGSQGNNNGWGSQGNNNGWGDMGSMEGNIGFKQGGFQVSKGSMQGNSGGRTVVSKSTKTKTSTVNGVTKIVKTTNITYSDGSTEEEIQETIK